MPEAPDHTNELRRLRERVYGVGAAATDDDIARLRTLESGHTGEDPALETELRPETTPHPDAGDIGTPALSATEPAISAPEPRRRRWWPAVLVTATTALIAAALAFGAGVSLATPPTPGDYPELTRPQTEEDVIAISADEPVATSVDLASTRFVARLDNVDIFIARSAEFSGICILTRDAGTSALVGSACSGGGPGRGEVRYGVSGGLQIVVGDTDAADAVDPIRLSESVIAYRE